MEIGALSDDASEARFAAYVESLAAVVGHADRIEPMKEYCTGLLLPGERKSIGPMAARLDAENTPGDAREPAVARSSYRHR